MGDMTHAENLRIMCNLFQMDPRNQEAILAAAEELDRMYARETELLRAVADITKVSQAEIERLRALTEQERIDAMKVGWNACRKSIYAVCEDVQEQNDPSKASMGSEGFHRGACYAAKSIARGFGAFEAEDDDNFIEAAERQDDA